MGTLWGSGTQGVFDSHHALTTPLPPVGTCTHPNQHPRPIHTTPTSTPPAWKLQQSASMSWQHRRFARSASDDVAGTWECFFVPSTPAITLYIIPLRSTTHPIKSEAREVPGHMRGRNHMCGSC